MRAESLELRAVRLQHDGRVAVVGDAGARHRPRVAHAAVHRNVVHAPVLPLACRRHRRLKA